MKKLAVVLLASLLLGGAVQAETIYGRVFNTLRGTILTNTKIILGSNPLQETTTNERGEYTFKNVAKGPYLIHIFTKDQGEVIGRLVVHNIPVPIGTLDIAKIEAPGEEDEY